LNVVVASALGQAGQFVDKLAAGLVLEDGL
jgi:hypothetical protein